MIVEALEKNHVGTCATLGVKCKLALQICFIDNPTVQMLLHYLAKVICRAINLANPVKRNMIPQTA